MENLTQLKDTLKNLQNDMRTLVTNGQTLLANQAATPAQLTEHTEKINALQARIDLTRATIAQEEATQQTALPAQAANKGGRVIAMLKSNEYKQAFAYAIRNRVNPSAPCPDPSLNVLFDAMTESGGTPVGSDGGFLVPDDVQTQVRERMRQLNPLRDLFEVEPTSASKGSRVMDTAPTTGLTQLDGEAPAGGVPEDDQPDFASVNYTLTTYGLIIPVSRELAADETANLFAYLARWYAKKQVITENKLLKASLELLTSKSITDEDDQNAIMQLRSILNMALDPAIFRAQNQALEHLYIINPNPKFRLQAASLDSIWSTHPPLIKRIARLRGLIEPAPAS